MPIFEAIGFGILRRRVLAKAQQPQLIQASAQDWAERPERSLKAAVLALLLLPGLSQAAVPVEDQSSTVSQAAAPVASAGQNAQLFYELQQLQTEVQELRGIVEEQAHEIERLRQLQRRQYLELDRRVAGLASTPAVRAPTVSAPAATAPAATAPAITAAPAPTAPPTDERAAYNQAFELMKRQEFGASISAFQTVLRDHPDGIFAPNSHYWLGELFLIENRLDDAKDAFNVVVSRHPAHQKVPDSLYKLGVVEHRSGNIPAALRYFDDVSQRYPDTPAAGLARSYAAELR